MTDDALVARALASLAGAAAAWVHVADAGGRLLHSGADAGEPTATTLRQLWERDRPTRPGSAAPLPFLETPGMRALGGVRLEGERLELAGPSGPRVVEATAIPVHDDGGVVAGVVLLELDVTRRDRHPDAMHEALQLAERRAQALQQQLDTLQERHLASLGRLASAVMHDMNNVLNPIMASAFLLEHHAGKPDSVREYAERIRTASEKGAVLSARVSRFVRQDPVHAGGDELVDLAALVAGIVTGFEPLLQARARGEGSVVLGVDAGTGVQTRGLPAEIREALQAVIRNALAAMPDGGVLTLRTRAQGDASLVVIEDSGTGMDEATRQQAFTPFFTTHRAGSAGLGLAEVYGIMRRHRGSATIESSPGEGTSVTLRFPAAAATLEPGTPSSVPAAHEGGGLKVLLVEDDDDGRDVVARVLRTAGHDVETAKNCAEARERLAAAGATSYHLLVTDVGLPDGSGWDLAAFAHGRWPALRIGVITGWEASAAGHEDSGAEFILQKPVRAPELLANIAGSIKSTTTG